MTITRQDLVIIKSADMTDNDTGGGLPSKEIVINNKSNEIFDDVSDLQATMGGVSLRKVFAGVMTDNNDKLMASRMAITQLPTNPNVSVFMFDATQWADTRKDAEIKLTSYLSLGSKWAGHLLENQLKGQQMIQLSLDAGDDIPQVGDSVALVQNEKQSDEFEQFVHIMKVETKLRKFQIMVNGTPITVTRLVATLEIGEPLRFTFNGLTVGEFWTDQSTTRRAVVHSTQVANANKIYSAGKLLAPIIANTTKQVQIDSIFTQVVPASTSETALPLLNPVGQSTALVKGADGTIAINKSVSVNPATPFLVGSSVYPSSVSLAVGGVKLTDVKGELKDGNNTPYASIDYRLGQITWYANANFGIVTVAGSYTPAGQGQLTRTMQSEVLWVDKVGAGKSYLKTLSAKPLAGSTQVSIQVLGKVYVAQDDGKGILTDTNGQKYGMIDFENKLVNLVLPAIPDAESAIIISYQTDLGTTSYGAQSVIPTTIISLNKYVVDGTLTIGSKTATLKNGLISGDTDNIIWGSYDYLALNITGIVAKNQSVTVGYSEFSDNTVLVQGSTDITGTDSFNFVVGKIDPNSLTLAVKVTAGEWLLGDNSKKADLPLFNLGVADDGNGNLKLTHINGADGNPATWQTTQGLKFTVTGAIDYATGKGLLTVTVTGLALDITSTLNKDTKTFANGLAGQEVDFYSVSYGQKATGVHSHISQIHLDYWAKNGSSGTTAKTLTLSPSQLQILIPNQNTSAPLLPNSVMLLGYRDSNGILVDGSGNAVGTVDYPLGKVLINDWSQTTGDIKLDTAVREYAVPPVQSVVFRTPIAPLKIGSMDIYLKVDGKQVAVKPDKNGIFNIGSVWGYVQWRYGVVVLYGNSIDPTSISYTAMSYTYVPLSSDVIGLDTAKLPIDGRVPFVRAGDFAVITENQAFVLDNPTPNKAYDIGIERLTNVDISDSNSKMIAPNHVVIDLDTGKFNLTADFAIGDYALPLTADYRLADYGVVTAVDISGQIMLNMTISHDYSNNAVFSTALINNGDGVVQARAYNVFSQKSWDAVFRDELNGSKATIQFNNSAYPIIVTNRSSVTERWALIFTSATNFRVVGETLGEVGAGTTSSDVKIINPITGQPYFVLPAIGWSQGGENNAVLRFNTEAAAPAIWLGSAIQPHQTTSKGVYDFAIEHQANVDRVRGQ